MTKQLIVYTAPGLDGEVRRVIADNQTWNVDVARQYAAYHSQDEYGSVPCDVNQIDIIDIRDPEETADGDNPDRLGK